MCSIFALVLFENFECFRGSKVGLLAKMSLSHSTLEMFTSKTESAHKHFQAVIDIQLCSQAKSS